LHEDKDVNSQWMSEIFADIMAIHYFGPMYALSLMDYFERVPYVQTIQHPEMCVRLYSTYQYLERSRSLYTDILHRCLNSCKSQILEKCSAYERSGELSKEKKEKLADIYQIFSKWFSSLKIKSFNKILREYALKANSAKLKKDLTHKYAPFPNVVFSYDEIVDLIFLRSVSLAIHPNILLNVILSNMDKYNGNAHFDVLVDSIKKWKIVQAWELSIKSIN